MLCTRKGYADIVTTPGIVSMGPYPRNTRTVLLTSFGHTSTTGAKAALNDGHGIVGVTEDVVRAFGRGPCGKETVAMEA